MVVFLFLLGEQVRHNLVTEKNDQARLDETKRHNKAMEPHSLVHRLHDHDIKPL